MNLSFPAASFPFTKASWIWAPNAEPTDYAVCRFRTRLRLGEAHTLRLSVSADSRYLLYWDGRPLGRGPARSDLRHYVYETYTVEADAGTHTLAAIVQSYRGAPSPIAEMHDQGVFLLEACDAAGQVVCATGTQSLGDGWRVQKDTAYRPAPVTMQDGYYGIGASEIVDGMRLPHGWEQPGFADAHWETPAVLFQAYPFEYSSDMADPGGRWRLIPRDIPPLREDAAVFADWPGTRAAPVIIPAQSRRTILVSAGDYALGYPVVTLEGGRGASVEIVYAEALTKEGHKGVRDSRDGTEVVGFADRYFPGGGQETYSPLHWRAFRFLALTVQTEAEPLTICDFSYLRTGYPWKRRAEFTVTHGPDLLQTVLDTDFRTLECCTAETFMDCPYYEQLQYVGDTRLQALLSYVTTGDTRLGARAVQLFDWSRLPEGLTQSRYPSRVEQIIPPFSLIWVLMVEDLSRHAPEEAATVKSCLPGCRGVLEWFRRHLNSDGVLRGGLPWWNFVDWSEGFPRGVPAPEAAGQPSATLSLQYLAAMQAFVRLHGGMGHTREADFWQAEADRLSAAIMRVFWDAGAERLREGPGTEWGSTQHAQAWGILTDAIPTAAWDSVCRSLHTDESLTKTTYYQTFYVIEALAKAGHLDQFWDHWLSPWRQALALHLSTWPERPEPTRSDCHAWSAWPTYAFLTHVLGVRPASPGFASYEIVPRHVAGWDTLSGTVPTPQGLLSVTVDWTSGEAIIDSSLKAL